MQKLFAYAGLLFLPFLIMIAINELNRPKKQFDITYLDEKSGKAYNSDKALRKFCTWKCHNSGCQKVHKDSSYTSVLSIPLIKSMDEGIKQLNGKGKGSSVYSTLNIATLVVFWPLLMFALLVINIELYILRRKNRLNSRI